MRSFSLSLLILMTGCEGVLEGPREVRPDDRTTTTTGEPPQMATPVPCTPTADPGRVLLRRLNRREYNAAVRDLFGTTLRPADAFPRDNTATYFDNDAALLGMTADQLTLTFAAATQVANDVMANHRAKIVTCDPANAEACARTIISTWGRRIFRASLTSADVDSIWTQIAAKSLNDEHDTFDHAIAQVLRYFLTSPRFLYRFEFHGSPNDATAIELLDGPALATRLSFAVWGSTPDDELLELAERIDPSTGKTVLANPAALDAQLDRMLADPRAVILADGFAMQWLGVDQIDVVAKSATLFPTFDDELRADLKSETRLFFGELFTQNRPLEELLTANYTFANERLAGHYGFSGVTGTNFRRVEYPQSMERSGFLSHGTFLANNSEIGRTSIVKRGEYVLDRLMCSQPGEPPANAGGLPAEQPNETLTLRQRIEAHRARPECAGCHARMDPIGFGLENFDAIGRWRVTDHGGAIDASGVFPDGRTFSGARQLATVLANDNQFDACAARNLTAWSLGRSITPAERCNVSKLAEATRGQPVREVIKSIARSDLFLKHRGDESEAQP
ncbi:MAG: DUF1592 domain-containing protein [Archangium sp.]